MRPASTAGTGKNDKKSRPRQHRGRQKEAHTINSIKQEIANNLLFYRKQKQLTQRELAERIGVKHNAVSAWENGANAIDTEMLFRLCEALEISINDMLGAYAGKENYSPSEREYIKKYRALDQHGRDIVDLVLDYAAHN